MSRHLAALYIVTTMMLLAVPETARAQDDELQATPVVPISAASTTVPAGLQSSADYCLLQSGILIERFPFVGSDVGGPIQLNGSRWFCEFTGSPEADPPSSRISIGLTTLFADGPTLATLAYLTTPAVPETDNASNLAARYCDHLGGSSEFGGEHGSGGGWASDPDNPAETIIGVCVFPDGSAIDDWGLTYHANGTIRGADLEPLLRYQPGSTPEYVFPTG